mgnify:CR=1 FL=1
MNYQQLINDMMPEVYASLKSAIEIGKWPNGIPLTETQQALCMEAVLHWQAVHLSLDQQTGYMVDRCGSKKTNQRN